MEFLCYHRDRPGSLPLRDELLEGQAADLAVPPDRHELIAYGPLLSDDGTAWLGTAVLLRAPDPEAARAILTQDRYADIEVHHWQFGGRPS
ncbi:YciI family protein [Streptomyces longwoodensis]|uniref:YciI family protein n=1 Tax=Streptomyces longwoodensis TaxID=68231 RepID=UPI003816AEB8